MQKTYLIHWGIKGQKWNVRRFQNEDGTLTEEGKKRYGKAYGEAVRDSNKLASAVSGVTGVDKKKLANEYTNEIITDKIKKDVESHNQSIDNDINSVHKSFTDSISSARNTTDNMRKLVNDAYNPTAPRMDLSGMTNKELQERINREYLERNYNEMFNQDLAKKKSGKEHVMNTLAVAGDVLAVAGSAAMLALAIVEIKTKLSPYKK